MAEITLTPYQKDILVRTMLGEARGEGLEGMADVAQVIFNRANSGQFPSDPAKVALQPNEFSTWNTGAGGNNPQQFSPNSEVYQQGLRALDMVLAGDRPDYTGGAIFYKTPAVKSAFHDRQNKYGTIERNGHLYYPTRPVPPGDVGSVAAVATQLDTTRQVFPQTQSTSLANQRSMIPSNASPALKQAMAMLASSSNQAFPATQSPDLAQMRNPLMSASAQNAQVTQSNNVPLPRARPSATDIVTPTMANLRNRQQANNAGDSLGFNPVNSPVTPNLNVGQYTGPNFDAWYYPDNPGFNAQTGAQPLRNINTPGTGGFAGQDGAPTANRQAALAEATRRAALLANQSNVERNPGAGMTGAVRNDAARRAALTANQSYVERTPSIRNAQLPQGTGYPAFPTQVARTSAPIQIVPNVQPIASNAPVPLMASSGLQARRAGLTGAVPQTAMLPQTGMVTPQAGRGVIAAQPQALPIMANQQASKPLNIVVNGAGSYNAQPQPQQLTPVQTLQAQGLSNAQAYSMLNSLNNPITVEDRVRGFGSSGGGSSSLSSW